MRTGISRPTIKALPKEAISTARHLTAEEINVQRTETGYLITLRDKVLPGIPSAKYRNRIETFQEPIKCKEPDQDLKPKNFKFLERVEYFARSYPILAFTICYTLLHLTEKFVESLAKGSGGSIQFSAFAVASMLSGLKFFINKQPTTRK